MPYSMILLILGSDSEVKGAAGAGLALNPNFAPHHFYQFLGDHQTQTGPTVFSCSGTVSLTEWLEQPCLQFLCYADTGVAH